MWNRVYDTSMRVYTTIPDYGEHDARLTADAAADTWYPQTRNGYRKRRFAGFKRMPAPGNRFGEPIFTQLEYVMPDGEIRGLGFNKADDVRMEWSDSQQAIYILPYQRKTECVFPPRSREDQIARRWSKGRPAKCSSKSSINRPPLLVAYPMIQISYSSDKFTHGRWVNYIHHFGPDVIAYFSKEPFGARRAPEAIMIKGGGLSLKSHGIDG